MLLKIENFFYGNGGPTFTVVARVPAKLGGSGEGFRIVSPTTATGNPSIITVLFGA